SAASLTSFFTRRYRNPLTPNGCAKCTCAPHACSTSTAQYQPYVASSTTSGSDPACSSCSPSATGSLTIRTAESCSPDSDWRTITDRRRCRSIPTNCLPSYSSIGASRGSWSEHPQHPLGTSRGAEAPPLHRIKRQLKAAPTNSRGGFRFGWPDDGVGGRCS